MMKTQTYDVVRAHTGYEIGDTREAEPGEVAHLVPQCLVLKKGKKAAPKTKNKAAPKNETK